MASTLSFHFDGPIAHNHQLSLRVLGGTLSHLQSAIDRAHLAVRYGDVWKYSRLKTDDYPETEFIVGLPREGGYILDLTKDFGQEVLRRIHNALNAVAEAPWDDGANEARRLSDQVLARQAQLREHVYPGRTLQEFRLNPGDQIERRYSDRSIAKEFDQMLAPIRRNRDEDDQGNVSTLEFVITEGPRTVGVHRYSALEADRFHQIVSHRALGEPLRYTGVLRALDRGTRYSLPKAKFTLAGTSRDLVLHMGSEDEYQQLAQHMQGRETIEMFASPILEFGAFDPNAGDIYFIELTQQQH